MFGWGRLEQGFSGRVESLRAPILGPGVCREYEVELSPLDGIGLSDRELDHVLTTVLDLVGSAARWQVGLDRVRAESRLTGEQWWRRSEPFLAEVMDGSSAVGRAPLGARLGRSRPRAVRRPGGGRAWRRGLGPAPR